MSYLFAFSSCSWGSQGKNTEVVCHSFLQWTMFCQFVNKLWKILKEFSPAPASLCANVSLDQDYQEAYSVIPVPHGTLGMWVRGPYGWHICLGIGLDIFLGLLTNSEILMEHFIQRWAQ